MASSIGRSESPTGAKESTSLQMHQERIAKKIDIARRVRAVLDAERRARDVLLQASKTEGAVRIDLLGKAKHQLVEARREREAAERGHDALRQKERAAARGLFLYPDPERVVEGRELAKTIVRLRVLSDHLDHLLDDASLTPPS